ncbi:MAG TPA: hypothetical protein PK651_05745 [Smithellaceae bacterium]|nr:hypothetical protein [Smithellaceae bacterium]
MSKEGRDILRPKKLRMGSPAEVLDITKNSLTVGLFCAIGAMVIPKDLPNLVH